MFRDAGKGFGGTGVAFGRARAVFGSMGVGS